MIGALPARHLVSNLASSLVANSGGGGPSYLPETIAVRDRKLAAGGSISSGHLDAINYFFQETIAAGLLSKLSRCSLFSGDDLTTALVPEVITLGDPVDTNVNFVSGDYTMTTGITSDGIKSLSTNVIESDLAQDNTHICAYMSNYITQSDLRCMIGGEGETSNLILRVSTLNRLAGRVHNASALTMSSAVSSGASGLMTASRFVSSGFFVQRFLTRQSTSTASTIPRDNLMTIFTGEFNYFNGTLGGYSMGQGFTNAEADTYAGIWNQTMGLMGRPTP